MKKSHRWKEVVAVSVRCPYCGHWRTYQRAATEGNSICCSVCRRLFELGKQK